MKRFPLVLSCFIAALGFQLHGKVYTGKVMTVLGDIDPMNLGKTVPHEHVLVDFRGAEIAADQDYDRDEVIAHVLPFLNDLKERGFQSFVECTPDFLGRDPVLLAELSRKTGLNFLTNTGFYPIREGKHVPAYAKTESADELTGRWTREFVDGIGDTGIRPGFIKISCSNYPLPALDEKIIRAAARTHLATGLTINMHTGSGKGGPMRAKGGVEALRILAEEGVAAQAFVWVHAQGSAGDWSSLMKAASAGAWISFDNFDASKGTAQYLDFLSLIEAAGYLDQVLVSQDNGWYRVGEENAPGKFKPYTDISDHLIPALSEAGWSKAKIDRLFIDNPRRAFTIACRRLAD